jgi:hypothetical protein
MQCNIVMDTRKIQLFKLEDAICNWSTDWISHNTLAKYLNCIEVAFGIKQLLGWRTTD